MLPLEHFGTAFPKLSADTVNFLTDAVDRQVSARIQVGGAAVISLHQETVANPADGQVAARINFGIASIICLYLDAATGRANIYAAARINICKAIMVSGHE